VLVVPGLLATDTSTALLWGFLRWLAYDVSAGYREVPAFNDEPYAHHWFEKPLTSATARPTR